MVQVGQLETQYPTANWTDLEGGANWFMAGPTDGTVARSQDGANWSDIDAVI